MKRIKLQYTRGNHKPNMNTENYYVKVTDRNIYFSGEIDELSTLHIQTALIELISNDTYLNNKEPINFYINSWGGSVVCSLGIVDIIQSSKTPVYTFNNGVCSSEGFLLLIAGHKRFGRKNTSYLIHQIQTASFYTDYTRMDQDLEYTKKLKEK